MSVSTTRLAELHAKARRLDNYEELSERDKYQMLRSFLHTLLCESLSPQEFRILDFVCEREAKLNEPTTARQVCNECHTSLSNASWVLKQLYEWGLLERQRVISEHGREFEYR